jgi:hypothetical protein
VQAHIDTRIALIMVRKTGMATTTETQLFVSSLTTVYPELRIVVPVLFAVYDVLSSEGQRLSGHSGVPLEYMLLAESDSYLISPILAGVQPILAAGNFGEIADRLSGAGIQHLSMKSLGMGRCCRRSLPRGSRRTPLMPALSAAADLFALLKVDLPEVNFRDLNARTAQVLSQQSDGKFELSAGGPACRVSVDPPPPPPHTHTHPMLLAPCTLASS